MVGSGIRAPGKAYLGFWILDLGSRGQRGTGSRIRIHNTDFKLAQSVRYPTVLLLEFVPFIGCLVFYFICTNFWQEPEMCVVEESTDQRRTPKAKRAKKDKNIRISISKNAIHMSKNMNISISMSSTKEHKKRKRKEIISVRWDPTSVSDPHKP